MPDIKTALSSALQEWDTGKDSTTKEDKKMDARSNMPQTFRTTNNITRMTFNYVRDNPGVTAKQAGEHIRSLGLKPHSAIAMMSASVGYGIMRREDNKYYTTVPEYIPLKKPKPKNPKPVVKKEPKPVTPQQGIKALLPEPKAAPTPTPKLTNDYILSNIDVKQALSLYRELINIFTGKL